MSPVSITPDSVYRAVTYETDLADGRTWTTLVLPDLLREHDSDAAEYLRKKLSSLSIRDVYGRLPAMTQDLQGPGAWLIDVTGMPESFEARPRCAYWIAEDGRNYPWITFTLEGTERDMNPDHMEPDRQPTNYDGKPIKLRSGDWGASIELEKGGPEPQPGDTVDIVTKAGKEWTERVSRIVWTGNGVSLVETDKIENEGGE